MSDAAHNVTGASDSAAGVSASGAANSAPARRRGRPKGHPKTGGRQKGTANVATMRAELLERSNAIEVLADICAGRPLMCGPQGSVGKAGKRYPTMRDRISALEIVLSKALPDLKSSEVTGAEGAPLIPADTREHSARDIARAVLGAVDAAAREQGVEGASVAVTVSAPGESLLRIRDPDLARKVLPNEVPAQDAFAPMRRAVVDPETMRATGYSIEQRFDGPRGRERWACLDPDGEVVGHAFAQDEARQICIAQAAVGGFKPRDQLPTGKLKRIAQKGGAQ